eukprot:scaffold112261_cov57-Phaeocystis_antarctica.AAC.1
MRRASALERSACAATQPTKARAHSPLLQFLGEQRGARRTDSGAHDQSPHARVVVTRTERVQAAHRVGRLDRRVVKGRAGARGLGPRSVRLEAALAGVVLVFVGEPPAARGRLAHRRGGVAKPHRCAALAAHTARHRPLDCCGPACVVVVPEVDIRQPTWGGCRPVHDAQVAVPGRALWRLAVWYGAHEGRSLGVRTKREARAVHLR